MYGASHEIYILETRPGYFDDNVFEHMVFKDLVSHLYEANGSLLLGVGLKTVSAVRGCYERVVLNPANLSFFSSEKVRPQQQSHSFISDKNKNNTKIFFR
jgi:hypothetical protein